MDNLGSEVGQKMRSAVKAKLIELGTGGTSGYIDDELPDYVMIMVANKRSKQQMISDLNLFLDSQTELFVTWLHEVLQKLQEVTLPVNAVKAKRKAGDKDDATTTSSSKKDKKDKKKEKKGRKSPERASITDVVAGQFLEKAKQNMVNMDNAAVKSKKESTPPLIDQFDIPTITEISTDKSREKDLAELAEIQKKIYEAKKHLKNFDEIEEDEEEEDDVESEEEDFLNITEDAEEFDEDGNSKLRKNRPRSPIIFDRKDKEEEVVIHKPVVERSQLRTTIGKVMATTENPFTTRRSRDVPEKRHHVDSGPEDNGSTNEREVPSKKRSIHDRLGLKSKTNDTVVNLTTHRRAEKEIYVPVFRRKEMEMEQRSRNREKRERNTNDATTSVKDSEKHKRESSSEPIRRRIGSRVIVAPPKPEVPSEDEAIDRPVNSVIKVKPRPAVSPSKQACKNLLLRAVAEAQRSTVLAKPNKEPLRRRSPSPPLPSSRNQKLYTKSYRDRINRDALVRRLPKDNILVEVKGAGKLAPDARMEEDDEDEYVPERISDRGESDADYVYIPQAINSGSNDEEYDEYEEKKRANALKGTQFVVTLDDKSGTKFKSHLKRDSFKNGIETKKRASLANRMRTPDRNHKESKSSTRPTVSSEVVTRKGEKGESISVYRKPKDLKKIIIQNDTDDDELSPKKALDVPPLRHLSKTDSENDDDRSLTPPLPAAAVSRTTTSKSSPTKRKRSPIKFDIDSEEQPQPAKRRSSSHDQHRDHDKLKSPKSGNDNHSDHERNKISTKKSEVVKKYDNIPELLSAISIDSSVMKAKSKDRCKFYPSCSKSDCEFYHPTTPCKAFPNCKFADKCAYIHPKCKFDLTCNKIACNFSHSVSMSGQPVAPPLSSHVVPVQNYKSITATALPTMCKFYPNCTNSHCPFYHPKLCRFGKSCMNKIECNFYHQDVANKDKFKWVASVV